MHGSELAKKFTVQSWKQEFLVCEVKRGIALLSLRQHSLSREGHVASESHFISMRVGLRDNKRTASNLRSYSHFPSCHGDPCFFSSAGGRAFMTR